MIRFGFKQTRRIKLSIRLQNSIIRYWLEQQLNFFSCMYFTYKQSICMKKKSLLFKSVRQIVKNILNESDAFPIKIGIQNRFEKLNISKNFDFFSQLIGMFFGLFEWFNIKFQMRDKFKTRVKTRIYLNRTACNRLEKGLPSIRYPSLCKLATFLTSL